MIKPLTAIKFHDIIGMLDTHLNQEEVDTMVKNNKQTFQDFYDPILIPSQTQAIMVLLRQSFTFKLVRFKEVSYNYLSVKLESAPIKNLRLLSCTIPTMKLTRYATSAKLFISLQATGV